MIERVKTGIIGLDEAISGGIPKGNVVLISGGAGTGKSTLCLHFLLQGIANNERSMYVSTEQTFEELNKQAAQYGWDLNLWVDKNLLKIVYVDILKDESFLSEIFTAIRQFSPQRLVLDSMSTFSEFALVSDFAKEVLLKRGGVPSRSLDKIPPRSTSEKTMTKRMLATVISSLRALGATIFLTSELPERGKGMSSDGISEFLADGVIFLSFFGIGTAEFRSLQVRKMRYTDHERKALSYRFSKSGIEFVSDEDVLKL
jgi:KaiC/GvpD/RAD55 family RecA-like ATPase